MTRLKIPGEPITLATETDEDGLTVSDDGIELGASLHPYGIPIADGLRSGKIEVVSGVLRQDVTTKSHWYFIADSGHVPVGFDAVYSDVVTGKPNGNLRASGGSLYVRYSKAYSRVISIQVTPDETLANGYGIVCGASVGLEQITIQAKMTRQIAGTIKYNGSTWDVGTATYQGVAPTVSYNSTNGALTVDHSTEFCRGIAVSLNGWFQASQIPYRPVIRTVGHTSFQVNFIDDAGAIVTGAASTRMSLYFSKVMNIPARLDGADGHDGIPFHTGGNLWVYGIMEV